MAFSTSKAPPWLMSHVSVTPLELSCSQWSCSSWSPLRLFSNDDGISVLQRVSAADLQAMYCLCVVLMSYQIKVYEKHTCVLSNAWKTALSPQGYSVSKHQESCLHSWDRRLVFLSGLNSLCQTCRTTVNLLPCYSSWRTRNRCLFALSLSLSFLQPFPHFHSVQQVQMNVKLNKK